MPLKTPPEPPVTAEAADHGYLLLRDLRELVDRCEQLGYPPEATVAARTKGFRGMVRELSVVRPVHPNGLPVDLRTPAPWEDSAEPAS